MRLTMLMLALLVAGCNDGDDTATTQPQVQQSTKTTAAQTRHDFTSISLLYEVPYVTVATEYMEEVKELSITALIRGSLSCIGKCELPISGQTPTGEGSTIFTIDTDKIMTDVMIDSSAKSRVCYQLSSGWFVKQYFYRGEVTQYDCNTSLVDTDVSNWEWDEVVSVTADIRGSGVFTISEIE